MRTTRARTLPALPVLAPLPGWILSGPDDTPGAAAFRSGAALAHLAAATTAADLPPALWRDRLALTAAGVCAGLEGRRDGAGALRDAVHLTRPGDDPGPAGRILRHWSQAVARPVTAAGLARVLDGMAPELIVLCLDAPGLTPVDRAARAVEVVLAANPRAGTAALILADAVLSKALGRDHVLPLLSLAVTRRDMVRTGCDLRLACHRAVTAGVRQALPLAADLARRAARLRAVAPDLRARGAARAVELFLSRDALAPPALARELQGVLSDRAARRLCERLRELGAVRELTGRDSFRLYGL
jgi:hypothetical protein